MWHVAARFDRTIVRSIDQVGRKKDLRSQDIMLTTHYVAEAFYFLAIEDDTIIQSNVNLL